MIYGSVCTCTRHGYGICGCGCGKYNGFEIIYLISNLKLNHRFGSPSTLNFELDPGPVLKKFGSNHGSEPNCGNTTNILTMRGEMTSCFARVISTFHMEDSGGT